MNSIEKAYEDLSRILESDAECPWETSDFYSYLFRFAVENRSKPTATSHPLWEKEIHIAYPPLSGLINRPEVTWFMNHYDGTNFNELQAIQSYVSELRWDLMYFDELYGDEFFNLNIIKEKFNLRLLYCVTIDSKNYLKSNPDWNETIIDGVYSMGDLAENPQN